MVSSTYQMYQGFFSSVFDFKPFHARVLLYLLTFYIFIRSLGGPPVTHAGILVISNDDHFAKEIKAIWIFDHV